MLSPKEKMNHILFIHMPIRVKASSNNIPLGPLLLATHLNKYGYDANILDLNVYRPFLDYRQLFRLLTVSIEKNNINVVCLSGLITTLKMHQEIATIIKTINPAIRLITGGGLSTDIGEQLFDWIPEIDNICVGPGENIIEEALHSTKKILTGWLSENIDIFDFDYSLIDIEKYISNPIWGTTSNNSSTIPFSMRRSLNSIMSRGCNNECTFCSKMGLGNKICYRSPQSLVIEMEKMIDTYNIDFLGYIDDNACHSKKRLKIFRDLKNNDLAWGTHARLDDLADVERVARLAESHCIYLGCGGESASLNILKRMKKGRKVITSPIFKYNGFEFPQIYIDALENCKRFGVHPNLTWISNYPGETLLDLQTTIAFVLFMQDEDYVEKQYNNRSLFIATSYPNTQLFNEPVVQSKLNLAFDSLRDYVLSLDDATKTIQNHDVLLNYSAISDEDFLLVREHIANDRIEKILDMKI